MWKMKEIVILGLLKFISCLQWCSLIKFESFLSEITNLQGNKSSEERLSRNNRKQYLTDKDLDIGNIGKNLKGTIRK